MTGAKIFITGIAGAGKSTVANVLRERGHNVIDVDQVPGLCAWVHSETGVSIVNETPDNDFIDTHEFTCNMSELQAMMAPMHGPIFVFGCVGDNSDFIPLFDHVLLFQCEPEVLVERLRTRDTNPFGKDPAVQERVLAWRKIFDVLMLEAGAQPINSQAPVEELVETVLRYSTYV